MWWVGNNDAWTPCAAARRGRAATTQGNATSRSSSMRWPMGAAPGDDALEGIRGLLGAEQLVLTAWTTLTSGTATPADAQVVTAEVVCGATRGQLTCARSGRPFDEQAQARLARLAGHLGRAVQLAETQRRIASLEGLLESLSLPALLLTTDAEVLWAAGAARVVLDSTDALSLSSGRLEMSSDALRTQLSAALRPIDEALPTVVRVPRADAPLWLLCWPVEGPTPRTLVVLHDVARVFSIDPRLLQAVYALTETEAELCAALVRGRTVLQFALDRGTSEATARVHLKRVLKKTGFGGQIDLVRGLLSGAFPRQGELQ